MSDVLELRKWAELTDAEKQKIITAMLDAGNRKDVVRLELADEFFVTEWTINSLMAHETMRRQKAWGEINTRVQEDTQAKVYAITSIDGLSEALRSKIVEEFRGIVNDSLDENWYDYYQDIEAISEYYDIDPIVIEQFLQNRFQWLWGKLDELKNSKESQELTDEDKKHIREYVMLWVDEKDKKQRRREMRDKYHVSIYVISAVTAWKTQEDGELELKKEIKTKTPEGIIENPSILEASQSEAVDLETIEEIDQGTGSPEIDEGFIRELATEYDLDDEEERKNFLEYIFDCFPDATIDDIKKILPHFPDDTTHPNQKRNGEGMWALVNYNNAIKNKWRQKLKEFIDENTDASKRASIKVLCLPGMECLEIPLYLELGFRPENIVWVEAGIVKWKKDPEVIARFQENAAKYWIQTRIGKLEKILETEETVFDVVSLDFLGYLRSSDLSILSKVVVSNKALLLINYLAKRENTEGKALIKIWLAYSQRGDSISQWYLETRFEQWEKVGNRDIWVPNIIEAMVGASKRNSSYFQAKEWVIWWPTIDQLSKEYERLSNLGYIQQGFLEDVYKLVIWYYRSKFVSAIMRDMKILLEKHAQSHRMPTHNMFEKPLTTCFYWLPNVMQLKQYKYISRTSPLSPWSPFFSEFMTIEKPMEDYALFDEYVQIFLEYLRLCVSQKWEVDLWVEGIAGKWIFLYLKRKKWFSKKRFDFGSRVSSLLADNHSKLHYRSLLENENGPMKFIREVIG